jgi:hypothetical protein
MSRLRELFDLAFGMFAEAGTYAEMEAANRLGRMAHLGATVEGALLAL